jgi:hypothetical protein
VRSCPVFVPARMSVEAILTLGFGAPPDALMWSIDQKAGDTLLLTAGSISQARQTKVRRSRE